MSSSYYIETSSAAAVDGGIEAVDTNNGSSQESSDNANSRTDTGTAGAGTEGAMPNDMPRDMGGQNGGAQTGPNGQQYYDADYKVVDDDENKK